MGKLLIADQSNMRASMLAKALQSKWDIYIAANGYDAVDMLGRIQPDALIINLNLSWTDGFSVLKQCFPRVPPIIIGLSTYAPPSIVEEAVSLGIGYIFTMPFTVPAVANQLNDMLANYQEKPQYLARHLRALGIAPHRDGYRYLIEALRLIRKNPNIRLQKELYFMIAENCGAVSAQSVERAIRVAIQDAWLHRKPEVWEYYFPGAKDYPSNGELIARLDDTI